MPRRLSLVALLLTACRSSPAPTGDRAAASALPARSAPGERTPAASASTAGSPPPPAGSAHATGASDAPASSAWPPAAPAASGEAWLTAAGLAVTRTYPEPHHTWRQVAQLHWQAVADGPPLPTDDRPAADGCPAGMQLVSGGFLLDRRGRDDSDEVLRLQNDACTHWLTSDHDLNGLCTRFDPERWRARSATLPRRSLRVCVDRYEYPNVRGEYPLVVVTFSEAERHCAQAGKRMCTESEWTLACEGEEGRPYPYGYERDEHACTIGILGPGPEKDMFAPRTTARTAHGVDHSWRGTRSGESPRCVSPYGVEDLTGNVDEWTRTVRKGGYTMIMKGGHWGPARQRCRPQTRGHGPHYVRYDQGFRCCADAPGREK